MEIKIPLSLYCLAAVSNGAFIHKFPSNNSVTCNLSSVATYLLPSLNGNVSQSFLQTKTSTNSLAHCENADLISYHDEFSALFAPNASLDLIYTEPNGEPVADEMGIWLWDHGQVWMASAGVNKTSYVSILDLNQKTVTQLKSANGIEVLNPNGGGYYDGKVYIAGDGDATTPPCIYMIDPVTFHTEVVINSYFGLRFGGLNDLTWASREGKSWLFFTDDPLSAVYNGGRSPQVPDACWRWDPVEETLLPVVDRTDVLVPNGIRVNKNSTKLYVTDTPDPLVYGAGVVQTSSGAEVFTGSQSSAIYSFDIDEDGNPSNRRLFGIPERGIADGLHLDDEGRVWTGEQDGIVVRSPTGKVLGMVNALAIQGVNVVDTGKSPLQNFALAGDLLVVLAFDQIYTIQLSSQIVSGMT
ncbi:SMP-30/Gluconolaconase/LRE-like domain-containing protein [Cladophialophora immunda]|nr:SMP-30/Gluconolaconase/LRE-like domain-containing protein [Cladophialophora immunda]